MQVRILKKTFGGVEFGPENRVLHLGGQNSAGVEKLTFVLPEEWEGKSVALHIKQMDGTLPTPILLDETNSVTVGKEFTASTAGLWMLLALGADGYSAPTRPAKYDCYETLNTDGDAEITPSQYETFVAQVLESAQRAQRGAQDAQRAASAAEKSAADAETARVSAEAAGRSAAAEAQSAGTDADRAEAAAAKAEALVPEDGSVVSVNGKGGAVILTAEDVGAVEADSSGYVKSIQLTGRTLTLTLGDGSTRTMTTQDTADLTVMTGVLGTAHGGTGKSTGLTAADVGAVADGSAEYIRSIRQAGNTLTLTLGSGAQQTVTLAETYTLPAATTSTRGGVKAGSNLTVYADGTLALLRSGVTGALGYTPAQVMTGTADLTAGSSALAEGVVYLVYQ